MGDLPKPGTWWRGGYSSIVGLPIMCQPDPTKNSEMMVAITSWVPRDQAAKLAEQIVALANGEAVLLPKEPPAKALEELGSTYTVYNHKPVSPREGRYLALWDALASKKENSLV